MALDSKINKGEEDRGRNIPGFPLAGKRQNHRTGSQAKCFSIPSLMISSRGCKQLSRGPRQAH
jgi:hypothetical protein